MDSAMTLQEAKSIARESRAYPADAALWQLSRELPLRNRDHGLLHDSLEKAVDTAGPINDPKHWRERAEEARAVADIMDDEKTKEMMRRIADDYERLAQRAEQGIRDER